MIKIRLISRSKMSNPWIWNQKKPELKKINLREKQRMKMIILALRAMTLIKNRRQNNK